MSTPGCAAGCERCWKCSSRVGENVDYSTICDCGSEVPKEIAAA